MSGRRLGGGGGGAALATGLTCMASVLALMVLISSPQRKAELAEKSAQQPAISTAQLYASMHPQFKKCAGQEDMSKFSELIRDKCGNLKQSSSCGKECAVAMRQKAEAFGCCWPTLMAGYKALDKEAGHAWTSWEQSLSEKCGVTFEGATCKSEEGKSELSQVEAEVSSLQRKEARDNKLIQDLLKQLKGSKQQSNACVLDGSQLRCGATTIALSRLPLPHAGSRQPGALSGQPDIYSWMPNQIAPVDQQEVSAPTKAIFPPKIFGEPHDAHLQAEQMKVRTASKNRFSRHSSSAHQLAMKDAHSQQAKKDNMSFLNILSDAWPWQRGAFKDVQQPVRLRPHKFSNQVFGDNTAKLRNAIPLAPSPFPDAPAVPERQVRPAGQEGIVWGSSHSWGPSDNRMKLEQRTSRRPILNLGSNSPWSKEAGLSRPHDPAARRLARAGVNVNGGLQV
ncbi:hypothetical protein GUITHDRAFT_132580 [Guillardia theta CCMP2712]|uniref:Uncharacterized protein n=1 Tax=Guillardia theta (strain CCMP2712) TaxID=905079 RepID=L1K1D5_GUITC|nr:hypothetical protein GUITHDRAFT_132580 [Guillardia theta CCMP2712]EKX54188.1 hypothetical protein GUITHDRAFT_132580 [Guillardia theta CCMP2712]|eukprot:XP_005841168.1 hypothetical protein GUITHDRAFT_132580 [Guillardia theta CCMP2712]